MTGCGAGQHCRCAERAFLSPLESCDSILRMSEPQILLRIGGTNFQTITFSEGAYLALPVATLQSADVAFRGVGIRNTTFVAESLTLKLALTVIVYCTCDVPTSVTDGVMRKGSLTFDVERYLGRE